MAELTATFTVDAPIDRTWAYLSNIDNLGRSVQGVTVRTVDADTSVWTMQAKAGFITKKFEITMRVTVRDEAQHRGEFSGSGSGLQAAGTIDLREIDPGQTAVAMVLIVEGSGVMGSLVDGVLVSRREEFRRRVADRVKADLERG